MDKLDQIVRRRPQPDTRVFLATSRDLPYSTDKAEAYADARRDLDARRSFAVQKYLTAQTSGRPIVFEMMIHDPAEVGISGVAARNSINSQRGSYTGSIGSGTGGGGGAQGSTGQQGSTGSGQSGGQQGGGTPPKQ